MVVKYIHGLDPSYDLFRANFYQNRTVVKGPNDEAVKVVSFKLLVQAALTEERRIKRADDLSNVALAAPQATKASILSTDHKVGKWCTRCNMAGHVKAKCFIEHPEQTPKGWKPRGKRTHLQIKGRAEQSNNDSGGKERRVCSFGASSIINCKAGIGFGCFRVLSGCAGNPRSALLFWVVVMRWAAVEGADNLGLPR